jgi:protein-tyrosine phosphatase
MTSQASDLGLQASAKMFERAARRAFGLEGQANWSRKANLAGTWPAKMLAPHGALRMDMTWVTGRIAVGGGIWTAENMAVVARAGVTHILDMQIEFDDTSLAEPHGIEVLWNPVDDDFQPKPPEVFQRGVEFALEALDQEGSKLFIHCAAGVHRAPMMTLAVLCSLSWNLKAAQDLIEAKRPVVDFADVYVRSVQRFLEQTPEVASHSAEAGRRGLDAGRRRI